MWYAARANASNPVRCWDGKVPNTKETFPLCLPQRTGDIVCATVFIMPVNRLQLEEWDPLYACCWGCGYPLHAWHRELHLSNLLPAVPHARTTTCQGCSQQWPTAPWSAGGWPCALHWPHVGNTLACSHRCDQASGGRRPGNMPERLMYDPARGQMAAVATAV